MRRTAEALTSATPTRASSSSTTSSLSLSTALHAPSTTARAHKSVSVVEHDRRSARTAPASEALNQRAGSLQAQVAALGQQLSEMCRRSEGEGIMPALPPPAAASAAPRAGSTLDYSATGHGTAAVPRSTYTHVPAAGGPGSVAPSTYTLGSGGAAGGAPVRASGAAYYPSSPGRAAPAAAPRSGIYTSTAYTPGSQAYAGGTSAAAGYAGRVGATVGAPASYAYQSTAASAGVYATPSHAATQRGIGSVGVAGYMPTPAPASAAQPHLHSHAPLTAAYSSGMAGVPGVANAMGPPASGGNYGYVGASVGYPAASAAPPYGVPGVGGAAGGYGSSGPSSYLAAGASGQQDWRGAADPGVGAGSGAGGLYGARRNLDDRMLSDRDFAGGASGGAGAGMMSAREEERLRGWLQEMRHERRRLEDRLLSGDSQGIKAQELRDDLEKQVAALCRQRDAVEAEVGGMMAAQQAAHQLAAEVDALRAALAAEQSHSSNLMDARSRMEGQLGEIGRQVEDIKEEHSRVSASLQSERDSLASKYKRAHKGLVAADAQISSLQAEVERLSKELQAREVSFAEVKASAEVLQQANRQTHNQLESSNRELESRLAELQRVAEATGKEAADQRVAAAEARKEAAAAQAQVKELASRTEFLRSEREKLLKVLQAEQAAGAGMKQQVEALQAQVRAAEASRSELETSSRAQLEALQREHEQKVAMLQKQFEGQLAAVEKHAAASQRQQESSLQTHEKLLEVHSGLRRERDALWAEAESLRADLSAAGKEKEELTAKIAVLRAEVKATMDDVLADRETRMRAVSGQHEAVLAEVRSQYEARLMDMQHEHEVQLGGALEVADRLKRDLSEASRGEEKAKATAAHLKEQLRDVLIARDDLERELAQEKLYNEELSTLVTQIKASARELPQHGAAPGGK